MKLDIHYGLATLSFTSFLLCDCVTWLDSQIEPSLVISVLI